MALDDRERAHLRARFDDFARTRDPALRDELVTAHLRLAIHLARRFANRGIAVDDLEQVAAIGLLKAVDRFEPGRGLEFSTFATPTILGELKRHFRDKGWTVRVPRRVQELHLRVNTLVGELTHQFRRSPTIAEIAARAGVSEEQVLEAIEAAAAYRPASLDRPTGDRDGPTEVGFDDLSLFRIEHRVLVDHLMAELTPRDQLLLRLRFYEEMTQSQIAERLGLSQMHVSRLLARCLDDLKAKIDDED
jgi:RNA polymerase sigma-B factor